MSWFRRPGESRGMNASADRIPPGIGQPDPGEEPVAGAHGLLGEAGIDVHQPELGAAEQPQRAVAGNLAPGQTEVAVGAVAMYERPAEVEAVSVAPHRDRYLPARRRRIAGHRLGRQPGPARHNECWPVLALPAPVLARAGECDVDVLVHPP